MEEPRADTVPLNNIGGSPRNTRSWNPVSNFYCSVQHFFSISQRSNRCVYWQDIRGLGFKILQGLKTLILAGLQPPGAQIG
jgi:hypothetical protein